MWKEYKNGICLTYEHDHDGIIVVSKVLMSLNEWHEYLKEKYLLTKPQIL